MSLSPYGYSIYRGILATCLALGKFSKIPIFRIVNETVVILVYKKVSSGHFFNNQKMNR